MTKQRFLDPIYKAHTVGFDRLLDDFFRPQISCSNFPPVNVSRLVDADENHTIELTLALAGFTEEDIEIVVENSMLIVRGESNVLDNDPEGVTRKVVHSGIANRAFERKWRLADNTEVVSASMKNGMLRIVVQEIVPEELQPKRIAITKS